MHFILIFNNKLKKYYSKVIKMLQNICQFYHQKYFFPFPLPCKSFISNLNFKYLYTIILRLYYNRIRFGVYIRPDIIKLLTMETIIWGIQILKLIKLKRIYYSEIKTNDIYSIFIY